MSAVTKALRLLVGTLPFADTVGGFVLRHTYYSHRGVNSNSPIVRVKDEISESIAYRMSNFSRGFKRVFEFTAIGICIAVMLGAHLFPVPFLGPVSTLLSLGTLKMLGISWGYTLAARLLGACVGVVFDTATRVDQLRSITGKVEEKVEKFGSKRSWFVRGLGRAVLMGLFGELGVVTATQGVVSSVKCIPCCEKKYNGSSKDIKGALGKQRPVPQDPLWSRSSGNQDQEETETTIKGSLPVEAGQGVAESFRSVRPC